MDRSRPRARLGLVLWLTALLLAALDVEPLNVPSHPTPALQPRPAAPPGAGVIPLP